jgi:hypothetical protein
MDRGRRGQDWGKREAPNRWGCTREVGGCWVGRNGCTGAAIVGQVGLVGPAQEEGKGF